MHSPAARKISGLGFPFATAGLSPHMSTETCSNTAGCAPLFTATIRSLELVAKRQADLAAQIPGDAGEEAPPPHY